LQQDRTAKDAHKGAKRLGFLRGVGPDKWHSRKNRSDFFTAGKREGNNFPFAKLALRVEIAMAAVAVIEFFGAKEEFGSCWIF